MLLPHRLTFEYNCRIFVIAFTLGEAEKEHTTEFWMISIQKPWCARWIYAWFESQFHACSCANCRDSLYCHCKYSRPVEAIYIHIAYDSFLEVESINMIEMSLVLSKASSVLIELILTSFTIQSQLYVIHIVSWSWNDKVGFPPSSFKQWAWIWRVSPNDELFRYEFRYLLNFPSIKTAVKIVSIRTLQPAVCTDHFCR